MQNGKSFEFYVQFGLSLIKMMDLQFGHGEGLSNARLKWRIYRLAPLKSRDLQFGLMGIARNMA